jgi:hypothetical protein
MTVVQKIATFMSDGRPHLASELVKLIDDHATLDNLQVYVSLIRKELRPRGEDILIKYIDRRMHYQHVRLLASAYAG